MYKRSLYGYSKAFVKYLETFCDVDYLDQETLDSLLPSRELVAEDEKLFTKLLLSDFYLIAGRLCYPLSYLFTEELLSSKKEEALSELPESPFYTLVLDDKEVVDGKEKYKKSFVPATFTKKQFLESTRKYSTQKVLKLEQ